MARYSLFPQQTGTYDFEASNITLGVSTGQRQRGFFFSQSTKPLRVRTNPLRVLVDNVPRNAPADFSGAIGSFNLKSTVSKRSFTTDQSLTVRMTISGDGDMRMVQAPKWKADPGLEFYDPNLIEENTAHREGKIVHNKVYEYLITAEKPGTYTLEPSMSYYNVERDSFIQLTQGASKIMVVQGESKNNYVDLEKEEEKIFDTIAESTSFKTKEGGFYGSMVHNVLLLLLFGSLAAVFVYKKKLENDGSLDPAFIRKQNAAKVALDRLNHAEQFVGVRDHKSYYEHASLALKHFLNDRFDIPAVTLKKAELLNQLREHNFDEDVSEKISQVINKSEQALYAPITVADMEGSSKLINEIIQSLNNDTI